MTNYIELGTAAVLDADHLKVGDLVELGGQLCMVDNITEDKKVFFKVVRGWPLWKWRFSQNWIAIALPVGAGLLGYLFTRFHLERFF